MACVTLRDVTERGETIEVGSNILAGADPEQVIHATSLALKLCSDWTPPSEYVEPRPRGAVAKILFGYNQSDHSPLAL